jgi:glycosyltransferase involved in cell wall biosynthesis
MKVLINNWPLLSPKKAGIAYYIENILNELYKKEIEVVLAHSPGGSARAERISKLSSQLKQKAGKYYPTSLAAKTYNFLMGSYIESPIYKANRTVDVYHEMSHCVIPNIFYTHKITKFVADIHDLSPFNMPEYHTSEMISKVNESLDKFLSADLFIVKSQHILNEASHYFKLDTAKFRIVPNAPAYPYKIINADKNELKESLSKVITDINNKNFILYTGTIEPRKNIKTLIKAFSKFRYKNDFNLVLAGGLGWKFSDILDYPKQLGISDKVFFTGYLPFDVFELLYNTAEIFVYPSYYEGFGMPNIEAMACGLPVITSNSSCLPEVVSDAAILFDPHDADELALKMELLVDNKELAEALRQKGFQRAKQFTWEGAGQKLYEIYEELLQ